jgi:hypothetical protein
MALLYEDQARLMHLARQLGSPTFLAQGVIDEVERRDPSWRNWWAFFASQTPDSSGPPPPLPII